MVTGSAVAKGEEEHRDRNSNQEEAYFAQYDEKGLIRMVEMEEDGWYPAADSDNIFHRFTDGNQGEYAIYNKKYLKELEDGDSYEIIICQGPYNNDYIVDAVQYPENAGTGEWQEGQRFAGRAGEVEVTEWLDSLNF